MWVACVESTLFLIAGLSAWAILRNIRARTPDTDEKRARTSFFLNAFKYCLVIAIAITPIQVLLGDLSGDVVAENQPEKLAALELNWNTNALGMGAPWEVVAWPASGGGSNAVSLQIPDALSLITTHSSVGTVAGLNSFAPDDRPTTAQAVVTFYAFRLMMLIGFALVALMLAGVWYWYRGKLTVISVAAHTRFLALWILAIPLGFIATESGWMVREIGRQPWIMYHLMRTADGVSSNLESPIIAVVIVAITLVYLTLLAFFIHFTRRIVREGPDLVTPIITADV